jgi:hypothetical protein
LAYDYLHIANEIFDILVEVENKVEKSNVYIYLYCAVALHNNVFA